MAIGCDRQAEEGSMCAGVTGSLTLRAGRNVLASETPPVIPDQVLIWLQRRPYFQVVVYCLKYLRFGLNEGLISMGSGCPGQLSKPGMWCQTSP